jgi:hypothetical protein
VAARGGNLTSAALHHAVGHQNVLERALHVAGVLANTTMQKGRWFRRPRQPTPEWGDADFAGVQAPVLRCMCKTKDGGMRMLSTTRRRTERGHRRGRSDGELRRRTDGGRQDAARSGDERRIPGTRKVRMSVERKGDERRECQCFRPATY